MTEGKWPRGPALLGWGDLRHSSVWGFTGFKLELGLHTLYCISMWCWSWVMPFYCVCRKKGRKGKLTTKWGMAASRLPSVWQVLEFTNNSSQQLFISFHFHSFADDSLIYLHCRISEASSAVGKPEDCISVIGHWMSANRLKLNADKTELLWVGSRHNLDSLRGCTPSLQLFFSASTLSFGPQEGLDWSFAFLKSYTLCQHCHL